jgi:PAS domain S-box-containing protein
MTDHRGPSAQRPTELETLRRRVLELEAGEAELREAKSQLQLHLDEMILLNGVTSVLASATDVTTALNHACAELARFLQVPQAGFAILNEEHTEATVIADYHPADSPSALGVLVPVASNPSMAYLLEHRRPLVVADAQTDPRLAPVHQVMKRRRVRSMLLVPLIVDQEVIGTLGFDAFEQRQFSEFDVDLIQHVANQVGQVLVRIQAEEALRGERDLAESMIETAQVIVLMLDTRGRIVRFNSYMEDLSGYRLDEVKGRDWFSTFLSERDREAMRDLFRRALRGDPTGGNVSSILSKNGYERAIEWHSKTLKDNGGSVAGLLSIGQDVTERLHAEQEIQQHAARLEALRELGLELAAELNLDDLLNSIVSRAVALVGGTSGGLYLYRPNRDVIEWAIAFGPQPDTPNAILRRGEGLSGKVWESGMPLVVDNYSAWEGRAEIYEQHNFRAVVAVPVRWGDEFLGVLDVMADTVGAFDPADAKLLGLFANQAAIAIQNAQLFGKTERQLAELALLFDTSAALATSLDVDAVARTIAQQIAAALSARRCAILVWDRKQDALVTLLETWSERCRRKAGPDGIVVEPDAPGTTYALADYPASREVLTRRQPLVVQVSDPAADPAEVAWMLSDSVQSLLMVPLIVGDQAIGTVELMEDEQERVFSLAEIGLAQTLANHGAAALENARLYAETLRRSREMALLNRVIAASATSVDVEGILQAVCRELALAFDAIHVAAGLLDEKRTEAVIAAEYRAGETPSVQGIRIPMTRIPMLRHLARHPQVLMMDDIQTDPRMAPVRSLLKAGNAAAMLVLPLTSEGEMTGVVAVALPQSRSFAEEEVDLAWRVSEQVSSSLARARLEGTQQRLSTAVEQSAESVIITDTEGMIVYVNPAFERITGYSRAEITGQSLRRLRSEKQSLAFYRGLWDTVRAGRIWQGRIVAKKKDGKLYTAETTITPVRDQAGEIVTFVGTMRDVTREVQLEEQFRQAQKMEALGRLAGGIAHDFNNLLTVINLSTRLMQRQLRPEDPLWEHVQRIDETGERAATLTRQLLSFSRRDVIEPRVLNLNDLIGELSRMLQRLIGEDVELVTRADPDLWPVHVDRSQIDQVIVNLSVNARDAMPDGGTLVIETSNVVLDEAYAAAHVGATPGQYVMLVVSDTGVGMSEEVKAHIYEPFFTTKERGRGTGLGLPIVYGIVKQNKGHVQVYSEEGMGTTFRIYLPRCRTRASSEETPAPARVKGGTETILVVEDKADVRRLTVQSLESHGYHVLSAEDGEDALRLCDAYKGPIHLLLTDLVMPHIGGRDLAERLNGRRPETRVLYMSGYMDSQLRMNAPGQSVDFLSKPFTVEALALQVRAVLEGRR